MLLQRSSYGTLIRTPVKWLTSDKDATRGSEGLRAFAPPRSNVG